jgi:hypothetical protein
MSTSALGTNACAHPRLRATEYDDTCRWVMRCRDCGHREPIPAAEWRKRMLRGSRRAPVLVGDEGGDSGRFTSLACLS